jgi:hypothetical protein
MARLANATAVILDVDVPAIFDAEYAAGVVGVGMGESAPQMVISSSAVPEDFIDMQISVGGTNWRVVDCRPDGTLPTGLALVMLEKP